MTIFINYSLKDTNDILRTAILMTLYINSTKVNFLFKYIITIIKLLLRPNVWGSGFVNVLSQMDWPILFYFCESDS